MIPLEKNLVDSKSVVLNLQNIWIFHLFFIYLEKMVINWKKLLFTIYSYFKVINFLVNCSKHPFFLPQRSKKLQF